MITEAKTISTDKFLPRIQMADPPHGHPDRCLNAKDLIAFGYSPLRWQLAEPETEASKPTTTELARTLVLAGPDRVHPFVRRPDTIQAMRNTCPKCESRSPAKVCRSCGVARRNVVVEVPFGATVPECAQWIKGQEAQQRVTVTGNTFDLSAEVAAGLIADPLVAELKGCSDHLVLIRGLWQDNATGIKIPVESLIDLVPREGTAWDQSLCTVDVTQDCTPRLWAQRAQYRGLHVRAALAQALHAAVSETPRPQHLWALVEVGGGHMTGHRRASPDMILEGRSALQNLLAAYARCLQTGVWPAFDAAGTGGLDAWAEVHLEPWMIDPRQGGAGYFAVAANQSAPMEEPLAAAA